MAPKRGRVDTKPTPVSSKNDPLRNDLAAEEAAIALEHDPDTRDATLVNYNTTLLWISVQLLACIFIFLLWAPNPSKATSIIASGTEFVGAIRKCTGTKCDEWLAGSGSGSGTAGSSEPTSESKSDSEPAAAVEKRAGSITDSLDLKSFFTHTGTAILATFYLSLFISICLMIRYRVMKPFTPDLPEIGDDPKVPRKEVVGAKRRALKIFAYRTSRSMAVINAIVLFGILSACGKAVWDVRVKLKLKGTDGIGGGLFLIMFALFFSLYSCLRDLGSPGGIVYRWVGCWCWCPNKILCKERTRPKGMDQRGENVELNNMASGSKANKDRKTGRGSQGGSSSSSSTRIKKSAKHGGENWV